MANKLPVVLLGTHPDITGFSELTAADRLAGVVNESDFGDFGVIVSDNTDTVAPVSLTTNTILGNVGAGIAALSLSTLVLTAAPEVAADFTAVRGMLYPVDTRAQPIIVAPPAVPVANDRFAVLVSRATAGNNVIVDFGTAGQNFYGAVSNSSTPFASGTQTFRYIDATIGWIVE